ncbi:hypothetical protein PVK06_004943 [Gossypium arboreum]|uniref:Uncharacterized protein n=1 Tax=Gossypium arboreum TaxID=29729 RepID=A0ABR0QTI7_GOSAR|nr:hypothetical protein PVK06_004943 [Gossypium arboreum]
MGFNLLMVLKEIWPLVRYHRREHFWTISKDNVVVPIIQKFYASLRDQKSRNTKGRIWDMVLVWEKEVQGGLNGNIAQEFARKNNILVPNYTLDMFGPTNLEQKEKEPNTKETQTI